MKRAVSIVLILVMTFSMGGCNRIKYIGWKEVDIKDYGTIKVPDTWMYSEHNGFVYLTDRPIDEEGCRIYFVETIWEPEKNKNGYEVSTNDYYGDIVKMDFVKGANISNGAFYSEYTFNLNGEQTTGYYLRLIKQCHEQTLHLVAFNKDITYETLEKIAFSHDIP